MTETNELRGIECLDVSEYKIFLKAPIDSVQKALQEICQGVYQCDVYGKEVKHFSFLVYQFKGNQWTTLHNFWPSPMALDFQDKLLNLSEIISSRIILYQNIYTTYQAFFYVYYSGQCTETLRYGADQALSVSPSVQNLPDNQQDSLWYIEEFVRQQGIFIPVFSIPIDIVPGSGGTYRTGIVKFIKPILYYIDGSCSTDNPGHNPEYLYSDFERVDSFTLA